MVAKDANVSQIIPKEKYNKGHNYKFLDIKVTLLGLLYYSFALFRKNTNMWLAKMIVYKNSKVLGNNISPTHIVIKIISWKMDTTLSERKILNKVANYENIYMLLLVLYIEFIF